MANALDSHLNTSYRIGLRVVKTIAAVVICLLISLLVGGPIAIPIMAISAIVTLQATQDDTIRAASFRVLGTAFGGALGTLTAIIGLFLPYYSEGLFVVVIPLMLLLNLYLCNFLKMQDACTISCVVIILVASRITPYAASMSEALLFTPDASVGESLMFTFMRLRDTMIGVGVATAVNVLPHYASKLWKKDEAEEETEAEG